MSRFRQLISEVHRRSLWQVLGIYAVASWVIYEVVQGLTEGLGLPDWFPALAVVLLLVGLPIVLATAFVQEGAPLVSRRDPTLLPEAKTIAGEAETAEGARRLFTWRYAILGGVVAFSLLFGFAGLYVVIRDRGRAFSPAEALAERAAPGIAVLPFSVRGADLDVWREGMVDLLSTGLDGVAGLRAIDSRTVLARWREQVGSGEVADQATALDVARATDAHYAMLGSAVAIGPQVRLVADIYEIEARSRMGQARVEGSPDSVLTLVDRLAVETLLIILQQRESELPQVTTASVTTASIPALKAWLEGEALHRRADFDAAIAAYERAIEADSTFALAYYQLSKSYGWSEGTFSERETEALQYARRWVDKLPAREAMLVRAALALDRNSLDGLEPLQQLVRKYPDDAHAWFELGEAYYHWGERVPVGWEEADRAFIRAVELDPGFAPYHLHPINIAFKYDPDSASVAKLIERYERLAPGSRDSRTARIAFDLAFGVPERRERVLAGLDTLDLDILAALPTEYLLHPRFWPQFEAVMLTLIRRGSEGGRAFRTWFLFWGTAGGRGYLKKALEYLDDPRVSVAQRACLSQMAFTTGLPVPEERLGAVTALASQIDSTSPPWWVRCVGTYAADRNRWADHAGAIEHLQDQARRALSLGDSGLALEAKAQAQSLEGYGLWRRGNLDAAVRILEDIPRDEADDVMRWWLSQLYLEQERWRDAVPYLQSYWWTPMAHAYYYLGQAYEGLEEYEEARKAYAYFVSAWQDADPELQPLVEAARRAIAALSPDQ